MNELNCYDYFVSFLIESFDFMYLSTINWKKFTLNIIGEKGSINMDGLCKLAPQY